MVVFGWLILGWILGMITALVIGWYAGKRHDKEGDQDANLFL